MKPIFIILALIGSVTLMLMAQDETEITPVPAGITEKRPIPADTEVVTTETGLKYCVLKAGEEGPRPGPNDMIKVHFTGWLEDGTMFDSTYDRNQPMDYKVSRVFPGWSEGFQLMTPGMKIKLTVPPSLAFGDRGMPPKIPPNATLTFEVELLSVEKGAALPDFVAGNPEAQKTTETGLVYEVIKGSEGATPLADELIEVKYAFWNKDGKLVDCSEMAERDLKYPVGKSSLAFMNEGALLLTEGATYRFEVPAALGFGDRGMPPHVAPGDKTIWVLELKKIFKPLPVPAFVVSPADKLKTTETGLKYEVKKEGDGKMPAMGQDVTVHYAGWLEDGTPFDNSYARAEPSTFKLGQVIPGWNEGLQLMKEGAVYQFTIPGNLAYGPQGRPPTIPPDATLIFHVELIKVGE